MSTLSRILRFIRPRAALACGALGCAGIVSATTVAYAYLAGPAMIALADRAPGGSADDGPGALALGALAASLLAITLVRAVAGYGARVLGARLGQSVVREVRERMYTTLLGAAPATWTGREHGDLAARIGFDASRVQVLVAGNLLGLGGSLLTLGGLTAFAFTLDPWLSALALGAVPVIGGAIFWLSRRMRRANRDTHARFGELSALAAELARTAPVIAAYGAEAQAASGFSDRARALEAQLLRAERWRALVVPAVQILGVLAVCAALAVGATRMLAGDLASSTFVSLFATVFLLYRPLYAVGSLAGQVAATLGALDRVDEVLSVPVTDLDPPGARAIGPMQRELRMSGVRFAYRPDEPVLEGIDLRLTPGESLAIAGSSGQGKTTLLALMLGLLRPDEGEITIDGVPVGEASPRSWRAQFAWVTQEPLLFRDTLLANVALADRSPDRERAARALERAGAADLLRTHGLDYRLAEGGRDLSGGQRQRVCIARALYRDAPILLFDEATSSLDGPTERAVAETIQELMRERTVVIVSHRLSAVQRADRVVVIEGGEVIESGSPRALWETGGRFHELFRDAAPPA